MSKKITKRQTLRRSYRQGFNLVELVFGLTAGTAVLCMAVGTVERTMKLSKDGQVRAEHQRTLARLGQQFRSDVHDNVELSVLEGAAPVALAANDGQSPVVRYRIDGSLVVREQASNGSESVVRETYRLDSNCRVRFDTASQERPQMIVVRQTADGEMLESRIVARTDRLGRLLADTKGQ